MSLSVSWSSRGLPAGEFTSCGAAAALCGRRAGPRCPCFSALPGVSGPRAWRSLAVRFERAKKEGLPAAGAGEPGWPEAVENKLFIS